MRAFVSPLLARLIAACILQALSAIAGIVPFVALANIARLLFGDTPAAERNDELWHWAWIAIAAFAVRGICQFMAATLTHLADFDFQLSVRRKIALHLQRLPLGWFRQSTSGHIKKSITDDIAAMHHLIGHSLLDVVAAVVTPAFAIAYLLTIHWPLTLVTLIPIAAGVALYARNMIISARWMPEYSSAFGAVSSTTVEFVKGIQVVKVFGRTGVSHGRFQNATEKFIDLFWRMMKDRLRESAAIELVLSPLFTLAVILTGGLAFITAGSLRPPDLIAFVLLALNLSAPVLALGYAAQTLQQASAAASRTTALLQASALPSPVTPKVPDSHALDMQKVSFRYDETPVLQSISLDFAPGTMTALIGRSGSGKSTLAMLVPRFWDPTAGSIHMGGVDLRDIASSELYSRVGFVFQDVNFLEATVRENLCLGNPDAGPEEVEQAARAAGIHQRICDTPSGYDAVVGAQLSLSGGEAQRLAIARAMIANAPIMVLDESTAFVDPESQESIQRALGVLAEGRTLLVIAHRLETITGADRICLIDEGKIIASGTHSQLLEKCSRYKAMWYSADSPSVEYDGSEI